MSRGWGGVREGRVWIDGQGPCWVSPTGLSLRPCRCQLLAVCNGQGIDLSEPQFLRLESALQGSSEDGMGEML